MNYRAASSGVSNTLTKRVCSKLLAMNPQRFKFSPSPPEPRCGPFQIGFLFQVGDFAGRSMARGRYRRQREYPQPPPPSKNNTTITINTVSIVSPLFGLSILNSDITLTRRDCCPILDGLEKNYRAGCATALGDLSEVNLHRKITVFVVRQAHHPKQSRRVIVARAREGLI